MASVNNQRGFSGHGESCSVNDGSSEDEGVLFVKANLSIRETIAILENPPIDCAISSPPTKPKGGQGFPYVSDTSGKEGTE